MTVVLPLPYKAKTAIDQWLNKFPVDQRQSAVLFALQVVQEENQGWLTEPLMDAVAAYLGMPKIAVYEIATFYSMFELKPVGKHKICVCTNIACMLCGSEKIMAHLKEHLDIELGETTKDGQFTLKAVECLAACGKAPVIQVGRQYYEHITPEKIDFILEELRQGTGEKKEHA